MQRFDIGSGLDRKLRSKKVPSGSFEAKALPSDFGGLRRQDVSD